MNSYLQSFVYKFQNTIFGFLPKKSKTHYEIEFYPRDKEHERKLLGFYYPEKDMDGRDWRDLGLKNIREFQTLFNASCGIYCLKMILKTYFDEEYSIVKLMKTSLSYNVYDLDRIDLGMRYLEFTKFIKREFGLEAEVHKVLSISKIKYLLSRQELVVASVSSQIRFPNIKDKVNKGGHLVLISGYNQSANTLIIQNIDGIEGKTAKDFIISSKVFQNYFMRRGVSVKQPMTDNGQKTKDKIQSTKYKVQSTKYKVQRITNLTGRMT